MKLYIDMMSVILEGYSSVLRQRKLATIGKHFSRLSCSCLVSMMNILAWIYTCRLTNCISWFLIIIFQFLFYALMCRCFKLCWYLLQSVYLPWRPMSSFLGIGQMTLHARLWLPQVLWLLLPYRVELYRMELYSEHLNSYIIWVVCNFIMFYFKLFF